MLALCVFFLIFYAFLVANDYLLFPFKFSPMLCLLATLLQKIDNDVVRESLGYKCEKIIAGTIGNE